MINFGKRVKELRLSRKLTKEDFCEDESELSVRQLTRIESGVSIPTLAKVVYIAQRLGVKIGELADEENFKLPERYKELKFRLLRNQTYGDSKRLEERERLFDEISEKFYESLPEEEQLVIDCLQAKSDVNFSRQTDFGENILADYIEQIKQKKIYSVNDLVLINLYFMCCIVSNLDEKFYSRESCHFIIENLLQSTSYIPSDKWFLLIKLFLEAIEINILEGTQGQIEELLSFSHDIMSKMQDFQYMPMFYLIEWKYCLKIINDDERAKYCYNKANLFAQMTKDNFLAEKLTKEWERDHDD